MKRNVVAAALLALTYVCPMPLSAQDNVADAERQQAEERYRTVMTRLERLEESIAEHQKSVRSLTDEVRKLKDEIDRLRNKNESAATQDSLKRLQEAILEVDKKRLADNERIAKTLEEWRKLILEKPVNKPNGTPTPGPGGVAPPTDPKPKPPTGNAKGYKYSIRAGDTLSGLVNALKKEGHKVTEKIIKDANPGVNWDRLKINQEIFIPETR